MCKITQKNFTKSKMKFFFVIIIIILSVVMGGLMTSWVLNYYAKTSSDALFMSARDKYENKHVSEAVENLFQSIAMNPNNYGSYFFLANIFNEHPDFQINCYIYRQALRRSASENVREIEHMNDILLKKCSVQSEK